MDYKIYPLGENALTIDFGDQISVEVNQLVINLSKRFEDVVFQGFQECVPCFSSLTIFYDVFTVRQKYPVFGTAFNFVKSFVESEMMEIFKENESESKVVEIPVSFDKKSALDLTYVAESNNLKPAEVVDIFLSKTYRVFMLGFLPGFAYMGELDERIITPRKDSPRTKVPKGSVGIAGRQTGIYPLESPGGWQIIGKTDVELFTPQRDPLVLFEAGDSVKFVQR